MQALLVQGSNFCMPTSAPAAVAAQAEFEVLEGGSIRLFPAPSSTGYIIVPRYDPIIFITYYRRVDMVLYNVTYSAEQVLEGSPLIGGRGPADAARRAAVRRVAAPRAASLRVVPRRVSCRSSQ